MPRFFGLKHHLAQSCSCYVAMTVTIAAGCLAAEPAEKAEQPAEHAKKAADLGPPLVDNVDALRRLHPTQPVWLDLRHKQVVMMGTVCQADYPLEFFVTYPDRSYEAIVSSDVRPTLVHAGLLAIGAKPGKPVQFQPEFTPPSGMEIAIEVRWKDTNGKRHSSPAQDWVRSVKTKKPLDMNWVFAGSHTVTDEETGENRYQADGGDFICLLNRPSALLDLPIRSESSLEMRLFEAFREHLPPAGTPVTMVLKPKSSTTRDKAPKS
jgi:hypothetical protein